MLFCILLILSFPKESNTTKVSITESEEGNQEEVQIKCLDCCGELSFDEYINLLTYEEKIRQVLTPAISPSEFDRSREELKGFGSYVFIDTLNQYTSRPEIIEDIQFLKEGQLITPLVGIDSEGGVVQRFKWFGLKSIRELKHLPNNEFCNELTLQFNELEELGINWSLSPVLDTPIDSSYWIYNRSIDTSPILVGKLATQYVKCANNSDIVTTAKHYPGHGGTKLDSHKTIPYVLKTKTEWDSFDRVPYDLVIEASIPAIMIGHLNYDQIRNETTSTSSYWMNDILRGEQGFNGLIVTDDLMMLQPKNTIECAQVIENSIKNGANLAIFASGKYCDVSDVTLELINRKAIAEEVLDQRIEILFKVKSNYTCVRESSILPIQR